MTRTGADSDSEEEMSEGEELRQAAAAAAAHSRKATQHEDVIVLSDTDDDVEAPPPRPLPPQPRPAVTYNSVSSQGTHLHPSARPGHVRPATLRPMPASLQPSSSHSAAARASPLLQVCVCLHGRSDSSDVVNMVSGSVAGPQKAVTFLAAHTPLRPSY